jgi:hypothetical protein
MNEQNEKDEQDLTLATHPARALPIALCPAPTRRYDSAREVVSQCPWHSRPIFSFGQGETFDSGSRDE